MDPEQSQKAVKFAPSNPQRIEENGSKTQGNRTTPMTLSFKLPKGGGDKPHTDGEGGDTGDDNRLQLGTVDAMKSGGGGTDKVTLPFGTSTPTRNVDEDDENQDDDREPPNVPR